MNQDDLYPDEDEYNFSPPRSCHGCGRALLWENRRVADGCACNSPRGINHGHVPKNTCTCVECDPAQTGSTRISADHPDTPGYKYDLLDGGAPWSGRADPAAKA